MSKRVLTVLAIDDHAEILNLIRSVLRKTGWTVAEAATPKDGLIIARTLLPDVIICDAAMPKMSGPEVIHQLKQDSTTANIPVILMTGVADSEPFQHVPWTNFLAKPFTPVELRDAILSASVKGGA
jgi:CheY-like chemotaxis protein